MQSLTLPTAQEMGIAHLSFSAIKDFHADPREFRKRYIDLDFTRQPSLAAIDGSAFHTAVESYWAQMYPGIHLQPKKGIHINFDEMMAQAKMQVEKEFPTADQEPLTKRISKADITEYSALGCEIQTETSTSATGRTTTVHKAVLTVEAIMHGVRKSVLEYINLRDEKVYTPLAMEFGMTAPTIDVESGETHVFSLKSKIDLIARRVSDGKLVIIDHKYSSVDVKEDDEGNNKPTPAMIMQAACYVSMSPFLLKELNIEGEIDTVLIDVFNKKTMEMTTIEITIGPRELLAWSMLFSGTSRQIQLAYAFGDFNKAFLPNLEGRFNKYEGWDEFMKDVDFLHDGNSGTRPVETTGIQYEGIDL